MKALFSILLSLFIYTNVVCQAPQKMSYQAVVRNSSGALVTNSQVGMRVSIIKDSSNGTVIFKEIYNPNPQTNSNGLVSLEIGSGIASIGTFAGIDWSRGTFFIKTETDPSGGTSYTIVGTSQLLSVPYALHAKTADSLTGKGSGLSHYIGELYQGGIIVSVWKQNGVEHGLIASLTDLSTSQVWSNITTAIGVTAQSLTDGQGNTTAIINQAGHSSSAAALCDAYSNGGYADWYLPAIWELNQIHDAKLIINIILGPTNGLGFFRIYYSSTEEGNQARTQNFETYDSTTGGKSIALRVRAVRRF